MKIKRKPTPPKRRVIEQFIEVSYASNLAEVLAQLPDGVKPEEVEVRASYDNTELRFTVPEEEFEFQVRQRAYEKKLKEWNDWFEANKNSYELHLAEKDKKRKRELEARKKTLDKQIAELQAKRKNL